MRWSKGFFPTLKEEPKDTQSLSHKLSIKAGLVKPLVSGVYSYLPLGFLLLKNIERVVREEMLNAAAIEVLLPALQPLELWLKSGRDNLMGDTMIRFKDRRGRILCLGPTHEEVITDLVKNFISSYRQLPLILFQIQTKFRDEIRPRFGLVRSCEFIMKDAYSFDKDQQGLDRNYENMKSAYERIFKRCSLNTLVLEADPGVMGGNVSQEFMVLSESGEDKVLFCPRCQKYFPFREDFKECLQCNSALDEKTVLELGHIFKLGDKYSQSLGAYFLDDKGKRLPLVMGCYGIGVSRMLVAVLEASIKNGEIIWPKELAPFKVEIVCLDPSDGRLFKTSEKLYYSLLEANIDVIFDDRRDLSAGERLKDACLLGSPLLVIVGKNFLKEGKLETELRFRGEKIFLAEEDFVPQIKKILGDVR